MFEELICKTVFELVAIEKDTRDMISKNIEAGTREEFNKKYNEFTDEVPFYLWHCEIIPEKPLEGDEKEIVVDHKSECYLV